LQQTFTVPDISCAHCKSSVEGALRPVEGVQTADVEIETHKVTVEFDPDLVTPDRLIGAIEGAGYEVAR
jgi:copper chaperone